MEAPTIPPLFLENMGRLLGEQAAAFQDCYLRPPIAGLRVNTLKVASDDLRRRLPYNLKPLPWSPSGFLIEQSLVQSQPFDAFSTSVSPGKHVYQAAGLYYLQEPSAMAVAELLNPQPGEAVLDLCAAPGGKTTHLAALMGNQGLLVANETHAKRVWELAENLERWGAHNTIITNESPQRLAEQWSGFFDKILVDAPCSGEGMFRKSEAARGDWSPDQTIRCAQRQAAILVSAAQMLKPGGILAYATCTFNPLENETTVARFLKSHPNFEILEIQPAEGFSPGQPGWLPPEDRLLELARAVRIWPHLAPGEGHFVALLRRNFANGTTVPPHAQKRPAKGRKIVQELGNPPDKQMLAEFQNFCQQNLQTLAVFSQPDTDRLNRSGAYLYRTPANGPDLTSLNVIHPGWWLGEFHSGAGKTSLRFEPSHALALGLRLRQAQRCLDLAAGNPQLRAYLRGETLDWSGEDGWLLVAVDGFPLGWGKCVRGQVKNFYPRGLRWV